MNRRGGVHGRAVVLRLVDDGGDGAGALAATRQLVERDGVFAIFGTAGTESSLAVRPYLSAQRVPHLFPLSGAGVVGGFRPSYRAEGRILGSYLARTRPASAVGVLYADDVRGRELLAGLRRGVARSRVRVVAVASDAALGAAAQVAELEAAGAEALALFVAAPEAAEAEAAAAVAGRRPRLAVATDATGRRRWPEGTVSIAWAKDPADPRWREDEALRPYRSILRGRGMTHLEGMAAAFELVKVLRAVGEDPTRAAVGAQLRRLRDAANPFLLPGVVVGTGPADRFPVEQAVLRRWSGGRWHTVGGVWRQSER